MTAATLHITRADLDANNVYIGAADVTDWQGDIEIAADLGWVRFPSSLRASHSIRAHAGSNIKAALDIKAGSSIKASRGVEAGRDIKAGRGIKAGLGIEAGWSIEAKWIASGLRIFAGTCNWWIPSPDKMQVRAELRGGVIAFGEHVAPASADGETA